MADAQEVVEARVAVLPKEHGPIRIETVELGNPTGHEVLIREFATGICHSQLHQMHNPRFSELVLGHEATGEVLAVGGEVTHVKPGDRVVLTFQPRDLRTTDRMPKVASVELNDGSTAMSPNIYTWSDHTIADDQYVIPVAPDTPTDVTAVVGCAVLTGAGAVLRAAGVKTGNSVAVWGVGGVGLNAVAAARMVGADPIIAVDVDDMKLELANRFGATHLVNAMDSNVVETVRDLTPGAQGGLGFRGMPVAGVDFAFDVVARPETFLDAFRATRNSRFAVHSGGTIVVVGVPQAPFELPSQELLVTERTIVGTLGGTAVPEEDIPLFLSWYQNGDLDLDALITSRVGFDEINEATKMLEDGKVLGRSIIEF
ncbi:MAG: zinc-binding dehydrogenase [Actinomycetia bacterium]|nr:zinc-binding dehydrogenase [Actinomycetes bacterium]